MILSYPIEKNNMRLYEKLSSFCLVSNQASEKLFSYFWEAFHIQFETLSSFSLKGFSASAKNARQLMSEKLSSFFQDLSSFFLETYLYLFEMVTSFYWNFIILDI